MNKLKLNIFFKTKNFQIILFKQKIKNKCLTTQIFFNNKNHPSFHLEEGVSTYKEEESALLVYLYYQFMIQTIPGYALLQGYATVLFLRSIRIADTFFGGQPRLR